MIDIEKLADAFLHDTTRYGAYYGFAEDLKQFAEAYAAKVLEDKEREIAELRAKLKHETSRKHINELQSHINDLRDAINMALSCVDEEINPRNYNGEILTKFINDYGEMVDILQEALSETPAQSLQSFENEVIERCAKLFEGEGNIAGNAIALAIRALKEGN